METTAINVSTEAYDQAADYARSHNTSVEKMVENFLLNFMVVGQKKAIHNGAGRITWREMEIPEEVRRMALPKIPGFPDEDKNMMETLLREKYESIS